MVKCYPSTAHINKTFAMLNITAVKSLSKRGIGLYDGNTNKLGLLLSKVGLAYTISELVHRDLRYKFFQLCGMVNDK